MKKGNRFVLLWLVMFLLAGTLSACGAKDAVPRILLVNTNLTASETRGYDLMESAIKNVLPDADIQMIHYEAVTEKDIEEMDPSAIILGGQLSPWTEYDPDKLAAFKQLIHNTDRPLLGICGGHQLLALAYGAEVAPIRVLDPSKPGYEGCFREEGFLPVMNVQNTDELLSGLPDSPIVYENHCDEVKELPDGFLLLATGADASIQAMRHKGKPIFGVQFHPEAADADHADGATMMKNFLELAIAAKAG